MPLRDRQGRIIGALELVQVAARADERIRAANPDIFIRVTILVISTAALQPPAGKACRGPGSRRPPAA
jgi:hypothetical protein